MASKIKAILHLRPKIIRRKKPSLKELDSNFCESGFFKQGSLTYCAANIAELLYYHLNRGSAIDVPALGTFSMDINLEGKMVIHYTPEHSLHQLLNNRSKQQFKIKNATNLGKNAAQLCELWNELHPEDPVAPDK